MDLTMDLAAATGLRSPTQVARAVTETWVERNLYCPQCGYPSLAKYPNNKPVADFHCTDCRAEYELKSGSHLGANTPRVPDGAYETMINRITSNSNPHLLLLHYRDVAVRDLRVIPKFFFTPAVIQRRAPLAPGARRAGWVGCNIIIGDLPKVASVAIVVEGAALPNDTVVGAFATASQLSTSSLADRGWLLDTWTIVEQVSDATGAFTLGDMYAHEAAIAARWPGNRNVRPKIRQQLQVLRDRGMIEFLGNGTYRRLQGRAV